MLVGWALRSYESGRTNNLFHGSFAGEPAAAASFLGSKPVMFGGAIASYGMELDSLSELVHRQPSYRIVLVQWLVSDIATM